MLPQEIVEALSKLSSERLQMILNFAQASSINERITRRYNVVLELIIAIIQCSFPVLRSHP
jgi:hypothetical protein